jgi:hypothetical protein
MTTPGQWFLQSGIRLPGGAVARYYNGHEGRNLPASTEITGYAASALAYLYSRTGEKAYLDAAVESAHFLSGTAWDKSLDTFPYELAPGSPAYFFDCGIIIRGLLAVYRQTNELLLLQMSLACGHSMARDFLTASAIHPAVELPSRKPLPYESRWSRQPGCFQLKSALAWRELAAISNERAFQTYWSKALRLCLLGHEDFPSGEPDRLRIMDRLHAYCYFLEGLLSEPAKQECMDALADGIERTARHLHDLAPEFARSDVYAQLLRVRIYADASGMVPLDRQAAGKEAAAIETFFYRDAGIRFDGSYSFGSRNGERLPFANPVSTAFCMQAMDLWQRYQRGEDSGSAVELI